MNKEDVIKDRVFLSKDGTRKIRIICVEEDKVLYEPIIFGNNDIRYIKMDKLLENFKNIDEC